MITRLILCNTRKCTHNGFVSVLLKWALNEWALWNRALAHKSKINVKKSGDDDDNVYQDDDDDDDTAAAAAAAADDDDEQLFSRWMYNWLQSERQCRL